jgi:hypothetical protein
MNFYWPEKICSKKMFLYKKTKNYTILLLIFRELVCIFYDKRRYGFRTLLAAPQSTPIGLTSAGDHAAQHKVLRLLIFTLTWPSIIICLL